MKSVTKTLSESESVVSLMRGEQGLAEPTLALLNDLKLKQKDLKQVSNYISSFYILLGQTIDNFRHKGQLLTQMRVLLEAAGHQGRWMWFLEKVLNLSLDTANNWMRLHEFAERDPELYERTKNTGIKAATVFKLSQVMYPSYSQPEEVAIGMRQHVLEMSPVELAELKPDDVRRAHRYLKIASLNVKPEVKQQLIDMPQSEDSRAVKRLSKLTQKNQVAVLNLIKLSPEASLASAIDAIQESNATKQASLLAPAQEDITVEAELVKPETKFTMFTGSWKTGLEEYCELSSLDLIFCEMPLQQRWQKNNMADLLRLLNDRLRDNSSTLLLTLSQQMLPYLGSYLPEGLEVGWTCVLHREHGRYPRIPGINIISGYVPMAVLYRHPYHTLHGWMVQDIQSYNEVDTDVSEDWAQIAMKADDQRSTPRRIDSHKDLIRPGQDGEKEKINTLERCIRYYLESYMTRPGMDVAHVVCSQDLSFGIRSRFAVREACGKMGANSLATLIGLPHGGGLDT